MNESFEDENHDLHGHNDHHDHDGQDEWSENQPPVDTFHDSDVASVLEESADGEGEDGAPLADTVAPKKKSSLLKYLPYAAGAVFAIVAGAFVFLQNNGEDASSSPTVTAQSPMAIPPMAPTDSVSNSIVISEARSGAGTSSGNADTTGSEVLTGNALPGSAPGLVPTQPPSPSPSPSPAHAPVIPSAAASAPSMVVTEPQVAVKPLGPTQGGTAQVVPEMVSAQAFEVKSLNERLDKLSGRVEGLQGTLDQTAQHLEQITANLASVTSAASAVNTSGIEDRLTKLEQKIAEQKAAPIVAVPATLADRPAGGKASAGNGNPLIAATEDTGVRRSSRHHHVTRVAHKASHKKMAKHNQDQSSDALPAAVATAPASGVLEVPHGNWILRAATPNEAWVAKSSSSSDLVHVKPGESLAGIGQVQSIRAVGDRWVIEGTEGAVH